MLHCFGHGGLFKGNKKLVVCCMQYRGAVVFPVCSLAALARFPLFCGGWGLSTCLPSSLSLRDDKATQGLYPAREQGEVRV